MYLEIISPEKVLFKGEVKSVSLPGAQGKFQMLNNHASILSTLIEGKVKFELADNDDSLTKDETLIVEGNILSLDIKGGVVEMNNNKATILPS